MKYFEETIGPARLLETDARDARGKVEIDDALGRQFDEEQEKDAEKDRLRLKEE